MIHRDLKPANIKVREDGTVKVLDFGLAKALDTAPQGDPSRSPTITAAATATGVIMGTAAYMAPEQASGGLVNKRVDIWSFGAVLFELLSGRRAFGGETVSHVLAAVLKTEPAWDTLPPGTPAALRTLLRRCLAKDGRKRIPDIAMARFEIDDAVAASVASGASEALPGSALEAWQRPVSLLLMATILVAISSLAIWIMRPPASIPVSRTNATVPPGQRLNIGTYDADLAISPDGQRLVFATWPASSVYVRELDQLDATLLAGRSAVQGETPAAGIDLPRNPFVSPDGEWVGIFSATRALQRVSIRGGPATRICDVDGLPRGATWGPDDTIVFATTGDQRGLWRVSATGGDAAEVLTRPDPVQGEQFHWWPEMLPNGTHLLFTIIPDDGLENAQIAVLSLEQGTYETVLVGGSHARYVTTGHLVYGKDGTLWAVGFDLGTLTVTGEPVPVVDNILMKPNTGAANFGVAQNGTLAYVRGAFRYGGSETLVWVDRDGVEEPLALEPAELDNPRLSPDGARVAFRSWEASDNLSLMRAVEVGDIHIYDIARDVRRQLTFTPEGECCPVWTPDGRVVFLSTREGTPNLWVKAADGTGEAEQLTNGGDYKIPYEVTADGTVVFWQPDPRYTMERAATTGDLYTVPLEGGSVRPLITGEFAKHPRLSPDGRWIAYRTDVSGREVLVRSFPDVMGGRWRITLDGGGQPLWAPDGRELFFRRLGPEGWEWWGAPVDTEPTFLSYNPEMILDGGYSFNAPGDVGSGVDISDDDRFLFVKPGSRPEGLVPLELTIVQNWFEELERLLPVN